MTRTANTDRARAAGRRVGRYEILGQIGHGGMSAVYRARLGGPAECEKLVALKLVHGHLCRDPGFVQLFLDEMRVAMAMSHRNVVQAFDADQAGDRYFMAMEWIDGCSLRELLLLAGEDRLPIDIAVFVGREVAAALDYAHRLSRPGGQAAAVIHRDVSPGNVLLSRQGDVKLTDFGVAKAVGRRVTQANVIKGKLGYMAPEQARGAPGPRSDVFSLGAVLYELVSGSPLRGENPTLDQVRSYAGPPSLALERSGAPEVLASLVARCLLPTPSDRPTARQLRRMLSDELLRLARQQLDEVESDPHERLKSYLAKQIALPASDAAAPAGTPEDRAAKMARMMWDHVEGLPTDPSLDGAALRAAAGIGSASGGPDTEAGGGRQLGALGLDSVAPRTTAPMERAELAAALAFDRASPEDDARATALFDRAALGLPGLRPAADAVVARAGRRRRWPPLGVGLGLAALLAVVLSLQWC